MKKRVFKKIIDISTNQILDVTEAAAKLMVKHDRFVYPQDSVLTDDAPEDFVKAYKEAIKFNKGNYEGKSTQKEEELPEKVEAIDEEENLSKPEASKEPVEAPAESEDEDEDALVPKLTEAQLKKRLSKMDIDQMKAFAAGLGIDAGRMRKRSSVRKKILEAY